MFHFLHVKLRQLEILVDYTKGIFQNYKMHNIHCVVFVAGKDVLVNFGLSFIVS